MAYLQSTVLNSLAFNDNNTFQACSIIPVTLSSPGATINSVNVPVGKKILLTAQTTASENGGYIYNGAAVPLTRIPNYNSDAEIRRLVVFVVEGSNKGFWQNTNTSPITMESTAITYQVFVEANAVIGVGNAGSTANPQGASIINNQLILQPANATNPGLLTTGTQFIDGEKTFHGQLNRRPLANSANIKNQWRGTEGGATQIRFEDGTADNGINYNITRIIQGTVGTNPTATLAWQNGNLVPTITNPGAGITGNLIARFDIGGTTTNQVEGYWVLSGGTATALVITRNQLTDETQTVNVTAVHVGNRNAGEDAQGVTTRIFNSRRETEIQDKLSLFRGLMFKNSRTINGSATKREFWLDSVDSHVNIRTNGFDITVYVPNAGTEGYSGIEYWLRRIAESTGSVTLSVLPGSSNNFRPVDTPTYALELNETVRLLSNTGNDWLLYANQKVSDVNKIAYVWRDVDLVSTTNVPTLSGLVAVSGGTPADGQRVGLVNQTDPIQNGIWIASATAWTRATDADANSDFVANYAFYVKGGVGAGDSYLISTPLTRINVGVAVLNFVKINNVKVEVPITNTSTTFRLSPRLSTVINNSTAAATFTCTAASFLDDDEVTIYNPSAFPIIIDPDTTQTVNGQLTYIVNSGESVTLKRISPTAFIALSTARAGGEILLGTTNSINALTVANTNLYTVPSGRQAVITRAVVRSTTANAITAPASVGVGVGGSPTIFANTSLTGLTNATSNWNFASIGLLPTVAGSSVIQLIVGTGATGTAQTFSVDLFGYLV